MPVIGRPSGDADTLDSKPGQLPRVVSICIRHPHFRGAAAPTDENDVLAVLRIVRIIAVFAEARQKHRRSTRLARGSKGNHPDALSGNTALRRNDSRSPSVASRSYCQARQLRTRHVDLFGFGARFPFQDPFSVREQQPAVVGPGRRFRLSAGQRNGRRLTQCFPIGTEFLYQQRGGGRR